jgi:hypothetical protein
MKLATSEGQREQRLQRQHLEILVPGLPQSLFDLHGGVKNVSAVLLVTCFKCMPLFLSQICEN